MVFNPYLLEKSRICGGPPWWPDPVVYGFRLSKIDVFICHYCCNLQPDVFVLSVAAYFSFERPRMLNPRRPGFRSGSPLLLSLAS